MLKKISISISIFVLIFLGTYSYYQSQREYIEGNILNLAFIDTIAANDGRIPFVWKNSGLVPRLLYRTLFLPDSTFEQFQGNLAHHYEILNDGLTYKVFINSGISWSDGVPFTVEDIKASVEAAQSVNFINGIYATIFSNIRSIETSQDTITIHLKEKQHLFLSTLSQFIILPKHVLDKADLPNFEFDDYWKNPIVTGMYKLGEFVNGKYFKLVRNEYFTGKKPKIDEVYLHINYSTVKLDFFSTNSVSDMVSFRAMRGMQEHEVHMNFYRYFIYNIEGVDGHINEAMQDVRVRQALAYAIDKEELLYNIYFKVGQVIDSGVLEKTPPAEQAYAYDPEKAKKLLIEAGYDFERPIRMLYYYQDETSTYFMRQVGKYFKAIGLKVETVRTDNGNFDLYEAREYDIALKGLASFHVDDWYMEYSSNHSFLPNIIGAKGEFDVFIAKLTKESDPKNRQVVLDEVIKLEHEKLYKLPLFRLDQAVYINSNRLQIPDSVTFGNTWYIYDVDFEEWEIKKK